MRRTNLERSYSPLRAWTEIRHLAFLNPNFMSYFLLTSSPPVGICEAVQLPRIAGINCTLATNWAVRGAAKSFIAVAGRLNVALSLAT